MLTHLPDRYKTIFINLHFITETDFYQSKSKKIYKMLQFVFVMDRRTWQCYDFCVTLKELNGNIKNLLLYPLSL